MNSSANWTFSRDSPYGEQSSVDDNLNRFFHLLPRSSQLVQEKTSLPKVSKTVIVFFGILFVSLVVNFIVLYTVISLPNRKRKRPATMLIAHLSSISIFFALFCVVLVSEHIKWVDLSGPGMCAFMSFLKGTILGIFSLNIVAIIYERFRVFNCFNHGKLLLCRVIMLIWVVAVIANIPAAFMVSYKENSISVRDSGNELTAEINGGICKPIPLMGIFEATVIYEFLRFLLFHMSVVCYMVYAMYKIRSNLANLKLLKPIPNEPLRKKLQNVRFIYIHLIIFILIWLPVGALIFIYRVRKIKPSSPSKSLRIGKVTGLLAFLYLVLNPLIYLCLDVGYSFCLRSKCGQTETRVTGEEDAANQGNSNVGFNTATQVKVNECASNCATGNGIEMENIQTESGSVKICSKLSKEARIIKESRMKSKRKQKELHSPDMSRISTFMASSTSSIK